MMMMMMMKSYLFATQIIEHNAHSLLIRVDNGLFLQCSKSLINKKIMCKEQQ